MINKILNRRNPNLKFKNGAFTLIEMLISISISMLFLGIIAGSFATLTKANKNANDAQKIYREARFVFDTVSQEIKSGKIDYECVEGTDRDCIENQYADFQKSVLALLHDGGFERTLLRFSGNAVEIKRQTRNTLWAPWNASSWQPLTSEKLPIRNGYFNVFPEKDPYDELNAEDNGSQWQPSIGVFLETGELTFKTTYSSRTYGETSLYKNL